MTEDIEAKLQPKRGAIARCGAGFIGIITSDQPIKVEYQDGNNGLAWVGIHLQPELLGANWSSRSPTVLFESTESAVDTIRELQRQVRAEREIADAYIGKDSAFAKILAFTEDDRDFYRQRAKTWKRKAKQKRQWADKIQSTAARTISIMSDEYKQRIAELEAKLKEYEK